VSHRVHRVIFRDELASLLFFHRLETTVISCMMIEALM